VTTPIYRRIAQELGQQVKAGIPEPGGQLPTELELAERYDASQHRPRRHQMARRQRPRRDPAGPWDVRPGRSPSCRPTGTSSWSMRARCPVT